MSIFFWYKNAALIEKQHPMVAGFFRLKDRKAAGPAMPSTSSRCTLETRQRNHLAVDHLGESF